jgi:hypothetical protein
MKLDIQVDGLRTMHENFGEEEKEIWITPDGKWAYIDVHHKGLYKLELGNRENMESVYQYQNAT